MEHSVAGMGSKVNEIFAFVDGIAQTMEICEVERRLLPMVMEIGREALVRFIRKKGNGYRGPEVIDPKGMRSAYVRDRACDYRSIFGPIRIPRAYYHCSGFSGMCPLDGELNLPERGYSYLVQEFSSKLAVNTSYENAVEVLEYFFPVHVPLRSLERIVGDLRDDVERYYEQRPDPVVSDAAAVSVATVDKKGVVIRKPTEAESHLAESPGDPKKPVKKKMATVISTYTSQRHVRTAQDIVREVSSEIGSTSKPEPQTKHTWASVTEEPEKTVAHLRKAVNQRLPQGNELVCILDGERFLWRLVYQYFPTAFFVLDIFHVLQHLNKAAYCFHDEGSPEAKEFVNHRLKMLLEGKVGRLIGGLKQMRTKRKLPSVSTYRLGQVIGYLERNKSHMRYHICLDRGYPIGSGVIEGACRHLINDRLELTGMRWTLIGAESVMRLRAVHINKDWKTFWNFRRKSERERLYDAEIQDSDDLHIQEMRHAA